MIEVLELIVVAHGLHCTGANRDILSTASHRREAVWFLFQSLSRLESCRSLIANRFTLPFDAPTDTMGITVTPGAHEAMLDLLD